MHKPRSQPSLEASLALQEPFLQRLARALVQDEHRAADLVQDTVAAALAHVGSQDGPGRRARLEALSPGRLRGWLSTVLRNTSIDRARAAESVEPSGDALGSLAGSIDSPDEIAVRLERQQFLHGALMALPEISRTALVLRYQDGLTPTQIAEATGCPLPTTKSRLRRGLDLLKAELERRSQGAGEAGPDWLAAVVPLAFPRGGAALAAPSALSLLTIPMWKPLTLAALAVLLVGAGVFVWQGSDDPALLPARGEAAAGLRDVEPDRGASPSGEVAAGTEVGREQVAGLGEAAPAAMAAALPALSGHVVSAMSGEPVPALVQAAGQSARASVAGGGFLLAQGAPEGSMLTVVHPRFERLEVPVPAWEGDAAMAGAMAPRLDLGSIELVPKDSAEVRVVDGQGLPVAGARCTLHRRLGRIMEGNGPGPGERDRARPIGVTDDRGLVRFRLAYGATFTVLDAGGRMGAASVSSGETALVKLDGPARELVVTERESGDPVAGRAFPLGWQRGSRECSLFLWTDERGRAVLPVGAGRLIFGKSEPRLMLGSLSIGDRNTADLGARAALVSDDVQADEVLLALRTGSHEAGLELFDGVSAEPIDGAAYWQLRRPLDAGAGWTGSVAETSYPVHAGLLTTHAWFAKPAPKGGSTVGERWIAVAGYRVRTIDSGVDLRGVPVALEPGGSRQLRLIDALGRPRECSVLLELMEGVRIRTRTGPDGRTEPLPWDPSLTWRVWASALGTGEDGYLVPASELESQEVVTLRDSRPAGGIRVTGVPAGSEPVFVVSTAGPQQAQAAGAGTLEFEGLPPGDYTVGPLPWATQMINRFRSAEPGESGTGDASGPRADFVATVRAGEVVQVAWDPRWMAKKPLQGHVRSSADLRQGFAVLPIYGRTGTPMLIGAGSAWIYCDEEGRFQTRAGDPEPCAFVFARFDYDLLGRRPVILDSQPVRADGEYSIALTSYELVAVNAAEWTGPDVLWGDRPMVQHVGDTDALGAPMDLAHGAAEIRWNPAEPLVVDGLPCHIHGLLLTYSEDAPDIVVPITPGGRRRIEIQVPLPRR